MTDNDEQKKLLKEAWKEAFKEVLLEQEATIGRWAIRLLALTITGVVIWLVLMKLGWTPPAP